MADYVSVLTKAIEGLGENTVETRADLYGKARAALERQLEALGERMSPAQSKAQLDALDSAIAEIETGYADDAGQILAAGFEDVLGRLGPLSEAEEPTAAPSEDEEADAEESAAPVADERPEQTDVADSGKASPETEADDAESVTSAGQDEETAETAAAEVETDDAVEEAAAPDHPAQLADTPEEVAADEAEPAAGSEVAPAADEGAVEGTADDEGEAATPPDQDAPPAPPEEASAGERDAPTAEAPDDEPAAASADAVDELAGLDTDIVEPETGTGAPADEKANEAAAQDASAPTADETETQPEKSAEPAGGSGGAEEKPKEPETATSTQASTTRSRLAEAFGTAEGRFGPPRVPSSAAAEGTDPLERVQSAVDELSAQVRESERKEPSIIPFSAPPRDGKKAGEKGVEVEAPPTPPTSAANDPAPTGDAAIKVEPIEVPGEAESSKAWVIWLGVALIVAGTGAWGYMNRDTVMPMLQSWTDKAHELDETAERPEAPKIDDRVPGVDGGETADGDGADTPASDDQAASDTPATDDNAPASDGGEAPQTETETVAEAPDSPAVNEESVPPTNAPPGTEAAILYEEAAADGGNDLAHTGALTWEAVTEQSADGQSETALVARTAVAMRGIGLSIIFRKNTDPSLPASHTVEIQFEVPADYPFGGVANIGGLLMKTAEPERGQALVGAAARVTDNFFIVGLSDAANDRATNTELMQERTWIDIPVIFDSGKRGIFTFAKGETGAEAFTKAMADWSN